MARARVGVKGIGVAILFVFLDLLSVLGIFRV